LINLDTTGVTRTPCVCGRVAGVTRVLSGQAISRRRTGQRRHFAACMLPKQTSLDGPTLKQHQTKFRDLLSQRVDGVELRRPKSLIPISDWSMRSRSGLGRSNQPSCGEPSTPAQDLSAANCREGDTPLSLFKPLMDLSICKSIRTSLFLYQNIYFVHTVQFHVQVLPCSLV